MSEVLDRRERGGGRASSAAGRLLAILIAVLAVILAGELAFHLLLVPRLTLRNVILRSDLGLAREEVLALWKAFEGKPQKLGLPSAPRPFLTYFEDESRPQTRLDRDAGQGMAVTIGRLRPDALFDYRFVALSHNTVRGAAGGAVLTAELLQAEGQLKAR